MQTIQKAQAMAQKNNDYWEAQQKKHEKYWREREEEQLKHNITDEKEYLKQIKIIHQRMADACQKEIDAFYGRYADKEGITIAEAKKRVSKLDIEAYERKAKRYVKEKDFSDEANEEMRLYNLTMKVNRLEMLKANIGLELISGHDELNKFMGEILQGRTEDELKRQAGILGKTVKDNAKTARNIVNASFHNARFSQRIWQYQALMRADLEKLLQSGLIQGKNPRLLARDLEKRFNAGRFNSERLMITELARVQTDAQKKSFEENGFEEYKFIVNSGCCPICKKISNKTFKVAKMQPGLNAPPMHPFCRCSTAAYEDSEDYEAWLDYLSKGGTTEDWNRSRAFAEKEESKRKYKYKDTVINTSEISSAGYRRKFTNITGENKISRVLWENALDMLDHRSGTKYEDLVFVDSKTGDAKINKNYDKENTASPSKSMKKMLRDADANTIIAMHNHPGSSPPSHSDIMACKERKYKYGLVVCHDGTIYKYSVDDKKINMPIAISALERLAEKGYTERTKKMLKDAGITLEVF